MAHSRSNMNITNPIKELVSKNRNRYRADGFNLDLTYITSKIIAMGFPASNIEGCYRNHIDDVVRMLDLNHKDHYMIYNLCSERSYDPNKFHKRVREFPFDDHNPPRLQLIRKFCENVQSWLHEHEHNVAVVHCKAGKGRTGTMICCYLLHGGVYRFPDEALNYYGEKRTQDQKGVTIPSQVRYVRYYARLLEEDLVYRPVQLHLTEIRMEPPPTFSNKQMELHFTIYGSGEGDGTGPIKMYKSTEDEMQRNEHCYTLKFKSNVVVQGDIKVELHSKSKISKKTKSFQFWFNTFFVDGAGSGVSSASGSGDRTQHMLFVDTAAHNLQNPQDANGFLNNCGPSNLLPNNRPLMLCLKKSELDIVNKKDKQHKIFSADFKITLYFLKPSMNDTWGIPSIQTQERSSPSSDDSGTDSSEWDSGESTVL